MPQPAGARDRRIRIERANITKNSLNEDITSWALVAQPWAEKLDISDGERVRAKEVAANISTRFRVLWTPRLAEVTPRDRIILAARIYEIVGIKEVGTRDVLEITANARPDLVV